MERTGFRVSKHTQVCLPFCFLPFPHPPTPGAGLAP